MVTPDETGWRVGALRHWLWAFATPTTTTVYAIRAGRGFDDAATVLGADFSGVLVRDGWAPYRRFTEALQPDMSGPPAPADKAPARRPPTQPMGRPGESCPASRS